MPQKFLKYKTHIIFYIQLLALLFMIFVINLASVGWDIHKVKFFSFGMMTFISIYSKMIATSYSSNLELLPKQKIQPDGSSVETNEIVLLENSILNTYHTLLESNRTGRFKDALIYCKYIYRLKNEIDIMDCHFMNKPKYKFDTFNIERRKILHELLSLLLNSKFKEFDQMLKNENVSEYVKINKMNRKSMRLSNLKMSTLFATKTKGVSDELDFSNSKVTFNKWSYSLKSQFVFLIAMPVLSFIYSGFFVEDYMATKQMWIDCAGYMFSLITGLFNGITIGSDAIQKGYLAKLQKRIETIQEILNIEKLMLNDKSALPEEKAS